MRLRVSLQSLFSLHGIHADASITPLKQTARLWLVQREAAVTQAGPYISPTGLPNLVIRSADRNTCKL